MKEVKMYNEDETTARTINLIKQDARRKMAKDLLDRIKNESNGNDYRDLISRITKVIDALQEFDKAEAATGAKPDLLDALPSFEVGQVVGDLHPGRRRHDWCSMHGDIGPYESIDGHARRVHGASSEAIREARSTLQAVLAASKEERP